MTCCDRAHARTHTHTEQTHAVRGSVTLNTHPHIIGEASPAIVATTAAPAACGDAVRKVLDASGASPPTLRPVFLVLPPALR